MTIEETQKREVSVIIIDFGSQYTFLILRRCREIRIDPLIVDPKAVTLEYLNCVCPKAIIVSGGPYSVYEENALKLSKEFWSHVEENNVPVLGICYGLHLIVEHFGGIVKSVSHCDEYGCSTVEVARNNENDDKGSLTIGDNNSADKANCAASHILFDTLPRDIQVWSSHGDTVVNVPKGFFILAKSVDSNDNIAAVGHASKKIWGLQFHPEVTQTTFGSKIFENFLYTICKLTKNWDIQHMASSIIEDIRTTIGDKGSIIGAVSGGVDSVVAATLAHRAVGCRLTCCFVETGLLRSNERDEVVKMLKGLMPSCNLRVIDASDKFLTALRGVTNPEEKRKIIGRIFIEEFENLVYNHTATSHTKSPVEHVDSQDNSISRQKFDDKFTNNESNYLLQGTLYPDVIESHSRSGHSRKIKTHHNVGGLPTNMKLKLIEPLKYLFKDEVRRLGASLGICPDILQRHPFPGPGLAIRILGEITTDRLSILREADAIFISELKSAGFYNLISQAFVVLLPEVQSVGVMGDKRTFEVTAALRVVCTEDYMTTEVPKDTPSLAFYLKCATRITNQVRGVNRVVLDLTSKPPATIEWL